MVFINLISADDFALDFFQQLAVLFELPLED
jgi:hypothetical protein